MSEMEDYPAEVAVGSPGVGVASVTASGPRVFPLGDNAPLTVTEAILNGTMTL